LALIKNNTIEKTEIMGGEGRYPNWKQVIPEEFIYHRKNIKRSNLWWKKKTCPVSIGDIVVDSRYLNMILKLFKTRKSKYIDIHTIDWRSPIKFAKYEIEVYLMPMHRTVLAGGAVL